MVVFYFILVFLLAFIPASIAGKKGYNSVGYYFFGLFLFLPALIVACSVRDRTYVSEREVMLDRELRNIRNDIAHSRNDANAQLAQSAQQKPAENPLIHRAYLSMEDGDWEEADGFLERVLDAEPENARAYIGKLCVELRVSSEQAISGCGSPIGDNKYFKRALQFADAGYRRTLESYEMYSLMPEERKQREFEQKEPTYLSVMSRIEDVKQRKVANECRELISDLEALGDYKDAAIVLKELSTPIDYNSQMVECSLCGAVQGVSRSSCSRCQIKFSRG